MITFSETIIETGYEPRSLCWSGGDLYDWGGGGYAVIFPSHPTVIEVASGHVLARLSHLDSGDRLSNISFNSRMPLMALDPRGARFALVQGKKIHLVQLLS